MSGENKNKDINYYSNKFQSEIIIENVNFDYLILLNKLEIFFSILEKDYKVSIPEKIVLTNKNIEPTHNTFFLSDKTNILKFYIYWLDQKAGSYLNLKNLTGYNQINMKISIKRIEENNLISLIEYLFYKVLYKNSKITKNYNKLLNIPRKDFLYNILTNYFKNKYQEIKISNKFYKKLNINELENLIDKILNNTFKLINDNKLIKKEQINNYQLNDLIPSDKDIDEDKQLIHFIKTQIENSKVKINNNIIVVSVNNKIIAEIYINTFKTIVNNLKYYDKIKLIASYIKELKKNEIAKNYTSLKDVANLNNENITITDAVNYKIIGNIPNKFNILIWGLAGSGKSTLAMRLLKDFTNYGNALYFTSEERLSNGTIQKKLELLNIDNNENFWFDDTGTLDKLKNAVISNKFKYIVIDSVNMLNSTDNELIELIKQNPNINFILIAHSRKDQKASKGNSMFEYYPDIIINVNQMKAITTKNRFNKLTKNSISILE